MLHGFIMSLPIISWAFIGFLVLAFIDINLNHPDKSEVFLYPHGLFVSAFSFVLVLFMTVRPGLCILPDPSYCVSGLCFLREEYRRPSCLYAYVRLLIADVLLLFVGGIFFTAVFTGILVEEGFETLVVCGMVMIAAMILFTTRASVHPEAPRCPASPSSRTPRT